MPQIGPTELLIVLGVVLLIFGPKRLPMLGRQLGSGFREFKDGIGGKSKDKPAKDKPSAIAAEPAADAPKPAADASKPAGDATEPVDGDPVPGRS